MTDSSEMIVSVCFLTYNHERYVEQSLMSVVNQKTDFAYEIVVGEDCSTDRTPEIVRSIQEKHSDKVRILKRERNIGAFENELDILRNCRGRYVAELEGDDYWTDAGKLQKQVDYLDQHPECSLCFTNCLEVDELGRRAPFVEGPKITKERFGLEDILRENFIPNCTAVYRNILRDYPSWFTTLTQCDWSTFVMLADRGQLGFIPQVTAVRRVHSGGIWSSLSHEKKLRGRIESLRRFDEYLGGRHKNVIDQTVSELWLRLAIDLEHRGESLKSMTILRRWLGAILANPCVKKKRVVLLGLKYVLHFRHWFARNRSTGY